jgi:hypothetical protein
VTPVAYYPRLPVELFRFTTGERAQLNTATLCAFGAANERLETWADPRRGRRAPAHGRVLRPIGEDELGPYRERRVMTPENVAEAAG